MQHADDGYSRRVKFGGSYIRSITIIHSPDGTNVRLTGQEFEGIGSVQGAASCKIETTQAEVTTHTQYKAIQEIL